MGGLLTLSSIKERTHAFDSFVTVEDANIPDYYREIIPHYCKCGGEIILTSDVCGQGGNTQLQCCNPDCWIKYGYRFSYFCKSLGFKGLGPLTGLALYEPLHLKFKYPTFLSIFEMPPYEIESLVGEADCANFLNVKQSLAEDAWPFKTIVAALGIPNVGAGSTLFDVVKDPYTLLNFILDNKIRYLCDLAGIKAESTMYYLEIYKLDIIQLFTEIAPHIISTPSNEVYVAITGTVSVDGVGLTRYEFINKCESLLDKKGRPAYKLIETKATSKLQYVIADAPSSSSKYELGKRCNCLITAQDFFNMLKSTLEDASNE